MKDIKKRIIGFPRRERVWKEEDKLKHYFRANLHILKYFDENPQIFSDDFVKKGFYKNGIGYRGVGKGDGFSSGLYSTATVGLPSSMCTNDHIVGATIVGEYVHEMLKENNYQIDWMVNKWLYDNLYLWATIKVTKEEHKKDNIIRGGDKSNVSNLVNDKLNLKHNKNVSDILA